MKNNLHILAVPNEDGFGPSALLSYIVKEMLEQRPDCRVTIWNQSRQAYNENLYQKYIRQGRLQVVPIWNLIQLHKDPENQGAVSIAGTLRRIGDYRAASERYPLSAATTKFDLVIDFGVPAAARWAKLRGFPSVTVFDHSWAKSLEMILADAAKQPTGDKSFSEAEREQWNALIQDIAADEAFTSQLYLFPEFITPPVFVKHWQSRVAPASIHWLTGVLGGRPAWTEAQARRHLGVPADGSLLMFQGGDTPIWAHLFRNLVPALLDAGPELENLRLNVVIYVPGSLMSLPEIRRLQAPAQMERNPRVRAFLPIPGGTIQEVLPFVQLLVTRAGGGTVNDAIACRTPFLCIPESTQSQVQAIHEALVQRRFTRTILESPECMQNSKAVLLEEFRQWSKSRPAEELMRVPSAAEKRLVAEIQGLLF